MPGRPWLGAPDFRFVSDQKGNARLKDFRERKAVLLVVFSWPQSQPRLESLRSEADRLAALGVEVLAVPSGEATMRAVERGALRDFPFTFVGEGAEDIVDTYALYARTLGDAGRDASGVRTSHIEFLIDRFGYIRARWIPQSSSAAWEQLETQISLLNREPRILPPPDEHVH